MKRRNSCKKNKLVRNLLHLSFWRLRTFFESATIQKVYLGIFYLFTAVFYFSIETLLWIGIPALLTSWGISPGIADGITIATLILVLFLVSNFGKSKVRQRHLKGEAKLAYWIAQNLSNRTSTEWEEYQDWLHDILLSRQQLLDAKCPQWKVKLITYNRLSVFCIVIGISKVKQVATRIRRSR